MANDSYSDLPSGLRGKKSSGKLSFSNDSPTSAFFTDGKPNFAAFLSILALLLSLTSIYLTLTSQKGLDSEDRYALMQIASDLRTIQQKEIVMTSPLKTTVVVDEAFPLSDIMPGSFNIELDETVPLDSQITATSNTGQIVTLNVIDDLRIKTTVPVDSSKLEDVQVHINKEIPIDTRFSATLKVNTVYGQEFNNIINKLEAMAQKK